MPHLITIHLDGNFVTLTPEGSIDDESWEYIRYTIQERIDQIDDANKLGKKGN